MVVADLHVHTTNSDGALALSDVCNVARSVGLGAIAITDHDRLHRGLATPVTDRDGLTVVHGIELRVATDDQRVDLLGYGARETETLRTEIERLQTDRIERGCAMVERVETHLDVSLDVTVEAGFGRPDLARAVAAHPETDYTVQDVFEELIGDDGPLYVARDVPSFERGRELLAEACDFVGLAHPLRYADPDAAFGQAPALDAIELHYPYTQAQAADLGRVRRVADRHDLLVTGGSDAHDDDLGRTGLDAAAWDCVRARLT